MSSNQIAPKLSYHQALTRYIALPDGMVYTVQECPIAQFKAFIATAVQTTKKPEVTRQALIGLNYYDPMDRWYALLTAIENWATLPLFASLSEAMSSVQVPQCLTSA